MKKIRIFLHNLGKVSCKETSFPLGPDLGYSALPGRADKPSVQKPSFILFPCASPPQSCQTGHRGRLSCFGKLCFGWYSWISAAEGKPWRLQPKEAAVVLFAWNTICFWRELPGGSRANECQEITSCPFLGFYLFSSPALWMMLCPRVLGCSWAVPHHLNLQIYEKWTFQHRQQRS